MLEEIVDGLQLGVEGLEKRPVQEAPVTVNRRPSLPLGTRDGAGIRGAWWRSNGEELGEGALIRGKGRRGSHACKENSGLWVSRRWIAMLRSSIADSNKVKTGSVIQEDPLQDLSKRLREMWKPVKKDGLLGLLDLKFKGGDDGDEPQIAADADQAPAPFPAPRLLDHGAAEGPRLR